MLIKDKMAKGVKPQTERSMEREEDLITFALEVVFFFFFFGFE